MKFALQLLKMNKIQFVASKFYQRDASFYKALEKQLISLIFQHLQDPTFPALGAQCLGRWDMGPEEDITTFSSMGLGVDART